MQGKTAFVTGGTSGINLAIAARFVRAGARVTVLGRNPEKAARAQAHLAAQGGDALALTADVRDYAAVAGALAKSVEAYGPIDILVNGAAGNFPAPALGMSSNGFKAVVDIDLVGTFNACRAAFEHLRRPGASVLSISAGQAQHPAVVQAHVCAAKAGVDMLTRVLAMEWGPLGVRVNGIAPGPIAGTEGMQRLAPTEEIRSKVTEAIPLQRFGTVDEMAEIALFLVSPAASYITGTVLIADGGHMLGGFGLKPMG
ncbi:Oxidoreductase, short chain dehydrogenase/reductase family [Chondromyces apiculatus DSM 436]|uniref:Oxidoreductase, short chain dehydrogenase/reductase family n=1 Tax=Chondromyces apiculatus DSM 436 TaxID=1192034 RepID=A0A017TG84_9BACT|nr:Oxidoreductase, short chain dehydrogenase/reductase family [Chondromyces apiculatus DSM 436]